MTQYIDTVISFPGTIYFRFNAEPANGTGSLANASAILNSGAGVMGFQPGAVVEHAVNENDVTAPFPGVPDGQDNFDFGYTWNTGLDAPTGSEYDLFSVILHELTHSMGLASGLRSDGKSRINGLNPGAFGTFDVFLEFGDGSPLFAAGGGFYR